MNRFVPSYTTRWFFLFTSPWILGFLVFTLGPMLASLYLAFCDYHVTEPPVWTGFHNFEAILRGWEPNFYNSIKVTATFAVITVPIVVLTALLVALLMNVEGIPGKGVYRTIFFLPSLLPAVATTLTWVWVFNPRRGVFTEFANPLYHWLWGTSSPDWLHDPHYALGCLVVLSVWGFGHTMLIFLAGLQGVPRVLVEAATIDGANNWERFKHITIPHLSPIIFFNVVMGIIGALQTFATAFLFGDSGINRKATQFYALNIYENGFKSGRFGLACALAWILFLAILTLTGVQFWFKRRWVHYND